MLRGLIPAAHAGEYGDELQLGQETFLLSRDPVLDHRGDLAAQLLKQTTRLLDRVAAGLRVMPNRVELSTLLNSPSPKRRTNLAHHASITATEMGAT
jgi:hypothetical protein